MNKTEECLDISVFRCLPVRWSKYTTNSFCETSVAAQVMAKPLKTDELLKQISPLSVFRRTDSMHSVAGLLCSAQWRRQLRLSFYPHFSWTKAESSGELKWPLRRCGRRRCSLCCCLSGRWSAGRTGCRSSPAGRWRWGSRSSSRLSGPSPFGGEGRKEWNETWASSEPLSRSTFLGRCQYRATHDGNVLQSGWIYM